MSHGNWCLQGHLIFLPSLLVPAYNQVLHNRSVSFSQQSSSKGAACAHPHTGFAHCFECRHIAHRPHAAQATGGRLAHLYVMGPFYWCSSIPGSAGSQAGLYYSTVSTPKSSAGNFICPIHYWLTGKMSQHHLYSPLHFLQKRVALILHEYAN